MDAFVGFTTGALKNKARFKNRFFHSLPSFDF